MNKIGHNNPPIDVPEHITEPIEYLRYLVRHTDISTVAKAVGHELCCCMNEDGFCTPSGKELMANTGIKDERTMTNILRIIEREIGIAVERKNGAKSKYIAPKPPTSNGGGYKTKPPASNVGGLKPPASNGGGQISQPPASNGGAFCKPPASNGGGKEPRGGTIGGGEEIQRFSTGSPTKKQPHQNNIDQIKKSDRENADKKIRWTKQKIDELFDEFWGHVPAGRKIGKPKARTIFEKIIRGKVSGFDEVDPQSIIDGMMRFNQAVTRDKTELQFIPHPTTWLNAGRWMDDAQSDGEKSWGWWRARGVDSYRNLSPDFWRNKIYEVKPNGVWPWQELGPPPGHPECLLPEAANRAYGEKYSEQVSDLIEKYGPYSRTDEQS